MEKLRAERLRLCCIKMQAQVRGFVARKKFLRKRNAACNIQRWVRGFIARRWVSILDFSIHILQVLLLKFTSYSQTCLSHAARTCGHCYPEIHSWVGETEAVPATETFYSRHPKVWPWTPCKTQISGHAVQSCCKCEIFLKPLSASLVQKFFCLSSE